MANRIYVVILPLASLCVLLATAYHGPDLPKGPFCGLTGECCQNRRDACSHAILDTLCYCDEHCNRTNDDCCPDYEEVCLGIRPSSTPPPAEIIRSKFCRLGDTKMDGCNKCSNIIKANSKEGSSDKMNSSAYNYGRTRPVHARRPNVAPIRPRHPTSSSDSSRSRALATTSWREPKPSQPQRELIFTSSQRNMREKSGTARDHSKKRHSRKRHHKNNSKRTQGLRNRRPNVFPMRPHFTTEKPTAVFRRRNPAFAKSSQQEHAFISVPRHISTCELDQYRSETWNCERDECIISPAVLDVRSTWRPANYSQLYAKKLNDGLVYKLGTLPLSQETRRLGAIRYDKDIPYPSHFDARARWPEYISPIMDQGWCGSDWAVVIASVASDRFAIQSNGAEDMLLSPQTLLSCNAQAQQGCQGGHIDIAWNFVRTHGLVDEDCFPYEAAETPCPFKRRGDLRTDGCIPALSKRSERYKVGPPGRLNKENDIMYDIMESGPVQAIMTVYQDFFHYRDGVYRHTSYGDQKLQGLHSVKIVGWGQERGDKYWIVANSWGTSWGEEGYFRIARGSNESGIESFVVTVLSEVTEA